MGPSCQSPQHRDTRWPPTALRQMQIDTTQRKMVSSIMQLAPSLAEQPIEYLRRRNRQATAVMQLRGKWSAKHCEQVCAWNQLLHRPCNHRSWPAISFRFRYAKWIDQPRRDNSAGNESRTCTVLLQMWLLCAGMTESSLPHRILLLNWLHAISRTYIHVLLCRPLAFFE